MGGIKVQFENVIKQTETKDVIPATKDALEKISECADIMENLEFGCVSCADVEQEDDGHKTVVDFPLCFDQFVGSANCDLTDKGYNKNLTEMDQRGLEEIGIAHGHGHFGAFHSGLDNKALKEVVVPSCFQNNREGIPPENPKEFISRVYSIVVNRGRGLYAEINYLRETVDEKGIRRVSESNPKKTIVVPVTDSPFTLDFSRESLVHELVSRVFFPSPKSVPGSFKHYLEEYKSLSKTRSDKKLSRFATKLTELIKSGKSSAPAIMQFIERMDNQFAERLKFVYDLNNPAPHIKDLFAFAMADDQCPDWIPDFVDQVAGSAPRRTIFRRRDAGATAVDDSIVEPFLDDISSEFRQEINTDFIDDLNLDILLAEKEAVETQAKAQPTLVSEITPYLAAVETAIMQNKDDDLQHTLETLHGYAKLALLSAIPNADFADLEKIMDAKTQLVLALSKKEITSIQNVLAEKEGRLDVLLSEQCAGLPEILVDPASYDKIKDTLTGIINTERSQAHRFAEDAMFFKEKLPVNWVRKHAPKAANYVHQLKKEIKALSKYGALIPGMNETIGWLKKQEQFLHKYVLGFFSRFESKIEDYLTVCTEHGSASKEAEKARSIVQEYVDAAGSMPSKPYWYYRNKMSEILEEIEDEH